MIINPLFLCLPAWLFLGSAAIADQLQQPVDPKATQQQSGKPSEAAAGQGQKECSFRTHDCEVCAWDNGKIVCSSVGIGCVPTKWRCFDAPGAR